MNTVGLGMKRFRRRNQRPFVQVGISRWGEGTWDCCPWSRFGGKGGWGSGPRSWEVVGACVWDTCGISQQVHVQVCAVRLKKRSLGSSLTLAWQAYSCEHALWPPTEVWNIKKEAFWSLMLGQFRLRLWIEGASEYNGTEAGRGSRWALE